MTTSRHPSPASSEAFATGAPRQVTGGLLAVLAALLLAVNNITVPIAYAHGSNPATVVLLRYVLLLGLLLVLLPLLGKRLRLTPAEHFHAVGAGASTALGSLGLLGAFAFIPVSLAVLIIYLYPLFTALGQSFFERRWPGLSQMLCLLLAFAGLAIALGIDNAAVDPRGIGLALVGAVGFATSFVWSRHGLARADNLVGTFFMSIAGALVVAAIVPMVGSFAPPALSSGAGWAAVLTVSLCFSIAFVGMFAGVRMAGATRTAMILNLEPVFTIALAATFLAEQPTPWRLLGGAIVLAAVVASQVLPMLRPKRV